MKALFIYSVFILTTVRCTIVEIPNGKLLGSHNGKYYSFFNVPYAQSPTDQLRFEPPLPYTTQWTNIRNATLPPIICVRFSIMDPITNGAEDCLVLNIFTPAISHDLQYPVQVYFHGGAFMRGSAENVDESYTVSKDIVLVIPSYRLGPLGFLSSGDDLISGNFGLKDQQLALKWVNENIHNFGGDPGKVYCTGFSAGGASVHLHMLNKISSKYFNAGMSMSGVAVDPWVMQPNPEEQFNKFVTFLGCQSADRQTIKLCLQSHTQENIFEATNSLKTFNNNPVNVFGVVVESKEVRDAFLTEHPRVLIQRGEISQMPWIVSHTFREGSYTAAEFLSYDENGKELIEILNSRWREIAPIVLFYNNSCIGCSAETASLFRNNYSDFLRLVYMQGKRFSVETYPLLEQMFTDIMFVNGAEEMANLHRIYGNAPVYKYEYGNPQGFSFSNFLANRSDLNFGE